MQPDTLILAFDTSAAYCAAALLLGDRIIAQKHLEMAKGQAENLFPLLEDLLKETDHKWSDISALAVGIGPGNFTGIRISVAAARGLALSLGVPAHGVSSLTALAEGTDGAVLACLDARRDGVFLQGFGGAQPANPLHIAIADLPAALVQTGLVCIGSGADPVAKALSATAAAPAFAPAVAIARIAARRSATNVARPAPLYLRAADAKPSSAPAPVLLP